MRHDEDDDDGDDDDVPKAYIQILLFSVGSPNLVTLSTPDIRRSLFISRAEALKGFIRIIDQNSSARESRQMMLL